MHPFSDEASDSERLTSWTCNGQGSNPGLSDPRISAISTPLALLHLCDLLQPLSLRPDHMHNTIGLEMGRSEKFSPGSTLPPLAQPRLTGSPHLGSCPERIGIR